LRVLARARGRIFRVLGAPDAAAWPELEQLPHWRQNTEGVRGRAPEHPPASRLPEYLAPAFCGRWHGGSGRPPRPHAPPAGHQTLAHTQPHFRLSATPRPAAENLTAEAMPRRARAGRRSKRVGAAPPRAQTLTPPPPQGTLPLTGTLPGRAPRWRRWSPRRPRSRAGWRRPRGGGIWRRPGARRPARGEGRKGVRVAIRGCSRMAA